MIDGLPLFLRHEIGKSIPEDRIDRLATTFSQTARQVPWERALFRLLRDLLGLLRTAGYADSELGPGSVTKGFRPILAQWHAASGRNASLDDVLAEAAVQWTKIRHPTGDDALARVEQRIRAEPPPKDARQFTDERYRRLTHACLLLQEVAWPGPFFLSCRAAARLAGFEYPKQASRAFRLLEDRDILLAQERGTPGAGRATRFMYHGASFDPPTDAADKDTDPDLPEPPGDPVTF